MLKALPILILLISACSSSLTGCASYPLYCGMSDAEIRQTIAKNIPTGTPPAEVKTRLIALRISERDQIDYPPTAERPHVLLARLFEPGGFHVDFEDELVEWVDVSFVFTPQETLDRVLLFHDGIRYFRGEPVSQPRRAAASSVHRSLILPPPPLDPLYGAN